MSIERIQLQPGYSISRIIKGGWHLAGGHGNISEDQALDDMLAFVEAGVTTFDCADIYTGVEFLIGKFLKKNKDAFTNGSLQPVQVHTKYVPDYNALANFSKIDTEKIIDRSLKRLGVEILDLVQFAWWDYSYPRYVETAVHLSELQQKGKIKHIGVTNFDGSHLKEILEAGVKVIANQVQYSVLDQRAEHDFSEILQSHDIKYLCYGVIAGGFLSDHYLGLEEPKEPLENRSLVKYKLIIEEFGGYKMFQEVLKSLRDIGNKYLASIAEVASNYILQKSNVGGIIVGARNIKHLDSLQRINNFNLTPQDLERITIVLSRAKGPLGPFYVLERDKEGPHGSIMKYNLNED